MAYCVRIPFRVSGLEPVALARHLAEVRDALAGHDLLIDVRTECGSSPGAVTVRAEVADNAQDAGRTAVKAVKAAVKAVGSAEMWKRWELDGPTRVTRA